MGEFNSRDQAEAARLLRMLGPFDPSPATEQRVYLSLARPARLGPRALRFATVTSVSLVATGVLAMTMGIILQPGAETQAPTAPVVLLPSVPPAVIPAPVLSVVAQPTPVVTDVPPAPVVAEAQPASRSRSPRATPAERRRSPVPREPAGAMAPVAAPEAAPVPASDPVENTEARVAAAPPEEAALVLAGLRALRRQHDPTQAGVLLARYLNRFPQGVLAQEALAIAIEAAQARGDRQTAAQLAARYLERFPAGRFVHLARKTVDNIGP
jgi:hypothetical protein